MNQQKYEVAFVRVIEFAMWVSALALFWLQAMGVVAVSAFRVVGMAAMVLIALVLTLLKYGAARVDEEKEAQHGR